MTVVFWQFGFPQLSHSGPSLDWIATVLLFPVSSLVLARHPGSPSRFFVFGVVGALLHLPRFLQMGRFKLWIQYHAPKDEVLAALWVAFACGLGFICWVIAKEREVTSPGTSEKSVDG